LVPSPVAIDLEDLAIYRPPLRLSSPPFPSSRSPQCTVAWAAMALVLVAMGASQRTFKQISWLGWVGLAGILPAIFIVVIAVGVSDRPPAAPPGPFDKKLKAFNNPNFAQAMGAVVNVIFAYCGTPGFFSGSQFFLPLSARMVRLDANGPDLTLLFPFLVIAEMKNPRDYNKFVPLPRSDRAIHQFIVCLRFPHCLALL
jgi:hypothetical protein